MPAAVYLFMALEAARQLSDNRDSDADSLRLSNVELEQHLPLSVFLEVHTAVEAQLIARQLDEKNSFAFEIFFQNTADDNSWAKHCLGNFETESSVEPSIHTFPEQLHDQTLMDQVQALEPNAGVGLSCLKLSLEGSSGEFKCNLDDFETYPIDPSILNSILRLPPLLLSSQKVSAEHHLSSVASLTVPLRPQRSNNGHFTSRVKPSRFYYVSSDIEIHQSQKVMSIKGLRYRAAKVIHQTPALNSLFFKPIVLPDVTAQSATPPMSISRFAELLTHKWPMCDIKIEDVPERYTASVLKAFGAVNGEGRSYFRSIKCFSIPQGIVSTRVQLVDGSDVASKHHMIIIHDVPPAVQLSEQLHSEGFLCLPSAHMQALKCKKNLFLEHVCNITGLGSHPWALLRKAKDTGPVCAGRRAVVFTSQQELPCLNAFEGSESVSLEPAAVIHFCEQNDFAKFDAIVIDCPENSVITTWMGSELMPWVQYLLKSADSILWVSPNRYKTPFADVAGSLLRTLQSEQPSLKVSWLVMDGMENKDPGRFGSQVDRAYLRMIGGEDELVRISRDSEEGILRYLPDDGLSADTGLSLPREVRSPLGEADYSLDFAAPGEPVILSSKTSSIQSLSGDTIDVLVEASVVDIVDLHISNHKTKVEVSRPHSGLFFAGKVLDSQNPDLPPERRVIGWHPDHAHRKKLSVRCDDLHQYRSSVQPSQAASRYAAIAVACCIVHGTARARQGETFLLEVQEPLLNAIKQLCERVGASVLNQCCGLKADFVVTFRNFEGILVNDRPIHLARYMKSVHGRATVQRVWQGLDDLRLQVDEYEIAEYKEAFTNAKQPCSTVLLHRNAANIVDHVPIYKKPAHLFMDHANYIVIGGLGGLGRFICSWMIENGAKHITAISRSGADTLEVRDAMSAMNSSGSSIKCIKADACDRKAISEILSTLRSERPVKGVINLAMVLGDAPMATMTAEEWDRGLRVKIDSSWILHEETLQDHLDFFILFSSIASVLGNRSQGNYNVANAFLNALAEYRQSLDLPGISVALGAMSKSANASDDLAIHRDRSF